MQMSRCSQMTSSVLPQQTPVLRPGYSAPPVAGCRPSACPGPPGPPSPGPGFFFRPSGQKTSWMDSPVRRTISSSLSKTESACGRPQQPGQGSFSAAGHTDENQILRLPPQDAFHLGNLEIPMASPKKTERQRWRPVPPAYQAPGAGDAQIFSAWSSRAVRARVIDEVSHKT